MFFVFVALGLGQVILAAITLWWSKPGGARWTRWAVPAVLLVSGLAWLWMAVRP